MAHVLARQTKLFRDELIKLCLIVAAREKSSEERSLFKTVLARTVVQRVENIGSNVIAN